jgi:hypothetical protein
MPRKKIDGAEASKVVRNYFDEVHGPFGVINFQILKTEMDKSNKLWIIECNFYAGFGVRDKSLYKVEVNATNGNIEKVTFLGQSK